MSRYKSPRWCFVPQCDSTSKRNPQKLFFPMPDDPKTKKLWFDLAHRAGEPTTSRYYCCEDHFELKDDMDNYVRYCLWGAPTKLKPNAVPHVFTCQNRNNSSSDPSRPAYKKLSRKRLINEILEESTNQENSISEQQDENAKFQSPDIKRQALMSIENRSNESSPSSTAALHTDLIGVSQSCDMETAVDNPGSHLTSPCTPVSGFTYQELDRGNSSIVSHDNPSVSRVLNFGESPSSPESSRTFKNKGVQVEKYFSQPHHRSFATLCKPKVQDRACQQEIKLKDQACSPIKKSLEGSKSESCSIVSSTSYSTSTYASDAKIPSDDFDSYDVSSSEEEKQKAKEMRIQAMNVTNYLISTNPKYYLGILNEWLWILDLLHSQSGLRLDHIKLTLMKIRLNDHFLRLGHMFGLSGSQVGRIFDNTVRILAHFLKNFVYAVPISSVKKNLPIPFRANFHETYIIIDSFEFEIEKPSHPLYQALTWSEYKKCNTIKYIIAITPDGTIVFISKGYGGRVTDVVLFEICGIMEIIPENVGVMADRGFKQIDVILNEKGCKLIRPPSVSTSTTPSKQEVMLTKRIASLRIHVERVIRRVREYEILKPHAVLDFSILSNIDDIVIIVSALINLQKPVIKT